MKLKLFMFLLIIPLVLAQEENFLDDKYLNININISSELELSYNDDSSIKYLNAVLNVFPRQNSIQSVTSRDITTVPNARKTIKQDSIELYWDSPDENNLFFLVSSEVRTRNAFPQINKKIKFPYHDFSSELRSYTEESDNIDINADIKKTASELVEGEDDYFVAVSKIAGWTKTNIKYDLNTLTEDAVQKSSWVLENKEGVCDEITNLFISLLRSVNIPARFISGIVYTNIIYGFGNHGWAEVYFPNYGWVPFDVTLGQFGWIDPSHVKFDDTVDSGQSAISYNWKSRNVDVNTNKLEIKTELLGKEGKTSSLSSLDVEVVKKEVGFGSYVPVKIKATNPNGFYLPLSLYITSAPGLLGENSRHSVLLPYESRAFYFIVSIPPDLDENYLYTAEIGVRTAFGNFASSQVMYSKNYPFYGRSWAEEFVKDSEARQEKSSFPDISLNCNLDKDLYYSDDNFVVSCIVKNTGNLNFDSLKICLEDDCKHLVLLINDEAEIFFEGAAKDSKEILISVESADMVDYHSLNLDVVGVPDIKIVEVSLLDVSYHDEVMLSFDIYSLNPAFDTGFEINNLGVVTINQFKGSYSFEVPVRGKQLINGLDIKISYKDEIGKEYYSENHFDINIKDIPWYRKFLSWLF